MENSSQAKTPNRSPASSGAGRTTYIAPGVKFKGRITGRGEVVVDGEVEGRVDVQSAVSIGSDGLVHGDIVARTVQVGGKLQGNVKADERFELEPSGRIEGDVVAPRVVIAEGAFFKGNVVMSGGGTGESTP